MRRFAFRCTLLNIVSPSVAVLCLVTTTTPALAHSLCQLEKEADGFTGSIVVKATPAKVFEAIKNSRNSDRRKVLSVSGNSVLLEEEFASLPVIGAAKCRYREVETPHKRIDYKIVDSKQFKRFDGKWELSPVNGGKSTLLKLTSCVDTYIKVPFSKSITDHGTKKDIRRRLVDIRARVEDRARQQISYVRK